MAKGEYQVLSKLESSTISAMFFFSPYTFMSLHVSNDNCDNLILFEFLVFSQCVSLGFVASNVHVTKSSFSSFDFLDGSKVDDLS